MKNLFLLFLIFLPCLPALAQKNPLAYDSTLARKLGADEYGMKMYVFVILKTGENNSTDKKLRDSSFAGHMKNIRRLVEEKKLVVAGPFGKNTNNYRGLFILNVPTLDEAKKLLETDPAIREKYLAPELYPWYGSAALPEYLPASERITKKDH